MKKTILGKMTVLLFALISFFMFFSPQTTKAAYELYGWPSYWYWYNYYYGYIKKVTVYNQNGTSYSGISNWGTNAGSMPPAYGVQTYQNVTGGDYYKLYNSAFEMKVGSKYGILVTTGAFPTWYNYGYTRLYIDLNADGDFFDANEFRGFSSYVFYYDYNDFHTYYNGIDITCATPGATSRIRAIRSIYYNTDPRILGYDYTYLGYGWMNYGEVEDYELDFVPDAPDSYPTTESLLYAGEWYDGTTRLKNGKNVTFNKPGATFRSAPPAGTTMKFAIVGPLPSTDTVYRAIDPVTASATITNGLTQYWTAQRATGITGNFSTTGSFKGVAGGEYKVVIEVGGAGCPGASVRLFTVSWDDDMAAAGFDAPKSSDAPKFFKYKRGTNVPISGIFQNVGINDVHKFLAYVKVFNPEGVQIGDSIPYLYDADNNPEHQIIKAGQKVTLNFGTVKYNQVGVYGLQLNVDYVYDLEDYNDRLPRNPIEKSHFEYQYDIQLQASTIFKPAEGEIIVANKPFRPFAEFKNVGISDASYVPVKIEFIKDGSSEVTIPGIAEDVPQGRYNTKIVTWDQTRLKKTGIYTARITISHPDDEVSSDNVYEHDFIVESGIQGNFTVGTLNETDHNKQYKDDRNFETIEEAMNAVYFNGLSGSVNFILTDPVYEVTSLRKNAPAWDMSSEIIGLGYNADINETFTMTWKASKNQRAATTINLNSDNGKGIFIGQSVNPSNTNAPFLLFSNPKAANSGGYITFDGGTQKALKIVLKTITDATVKHGSAFYLTQGSNNITIKNCIIDNGVASVKNNVQVPSVLYGLDGFKFDLDQMLYPDNSTRSYSSGVVIRSRLFTQVENINIPVDTVLSSNNTIMGNEISNFGYGVTSLGIGQLFVNKTGLFTGYYNMNNKIESNKIYNVARAGVYAGNEMGLSVKNNRIYNVGNGVNDAYGILLGGNTTTRARGYHNLQAKVDGNEISGVSSPMATAGIKVEQVAISYPTGVKPVVFPRLDEAAEIYNNNIWGLDITNANATIAGIHLTTERKSSSSADMANGFYTDYFSANDRIYNNTIVINTPTVRSNVATVGIGLQNTYATRLVNNAIALTDMNDVGAYSAALLYEGTSPNWLRNLDQNVTVKGNSNINKGIYSNRNVFWLGTANPKNAASSLIRYVETKLDGTILSTGFKKEYVTLDQWQSWTNSDEQSFYGDFVSDMELTGSNPQNYTVKSNPAPLGSILNNRGVALLDNQKDLSGLPRGAVGQRYDIGAIEFNGRQYTVDLQAAEVVAPREYQSVTDPNFSDAQYIMTTAPVDVKSRIFNNGTLQQAGAKVKLEIFVQGIDGMYTTSVLTKEVEIDLASNEHLDVDFMLANGDADDFVPKTYGDFNYELRQNNAPEYMIPSMFTTMADNVTPIYKIVVNVESDQMNTNNMTEKYLRFYLKKSELNMIVSGTYTNANITSDPYAVAQQTLISKLNYDALITTLDKLGWTSDWTKNKHKVDYFDRNSWEPRAVNYNDYVHLFWSDGINMPNDRILEAGINSFLSSSDDQDWLKKNLIIASEEWAQIAANTPFAQDVLRAKFLSNNANGNNTTYKGREITGTNVARDRKLNIIRPQFFDFNIMAMNDYPSDVNPFPAVLQVLNTDVDGALLPGIAKDAFKYTGTQDNVMTRVMGVATSTLEQNIVYLGADWRNIGDVETVVRGAVDFLQRNGSDIVPVELTEFDAEQKGQSIVLDWTTAVEVNSSKFVIERANVLDKQTGNFEAIDEIAAAGHSVTPTQYTRVDANVSYGNTYAYRLKIVSKDGNFDYSDVRVKTLTGSNGVATMSAAMPNPTSNEATFNYSLSADMNVNISIYDVNGALISNTLESQTAGTHEFKASFANLANGVYKVVLSSGDLYITRSVTVAK